MEKANYEGWPTTRCYPRSLAEAFKDDIQNSQWWYPPEKEPLNVVEALMWSAGVSMWISIAYLFANN